MKDLPPPYLSARRTRDRSIVLLLAGLMLLMPPIAGVFEIDAKLAGVPVTLLYVTLVWAGLILGAYRLSRHLADSEARDRATAKDPDARTLAPPE